MKWPLSMIEKNFVGAIIKLHVLSRRRVRTPLRHGRPQRRSRNPSLNPLFSKMAATLRRKHDNQRRRRRDPRYRFPLCLLVLLLVQKIELFCLLPHQRRWRPWFPEVIYYSVDVERARSHVKEAINKGYWKKEDWPEMKNKILKLLNLNDASLDLAG
ncbi:hypothetical protein GLOIN_2v1781805 [Rhizophagus clarus]|uniref:Uncharacterized protein n=1 Tax=Rhizophagus clarus TaxID=94130 RepID=A0A8H3LCZ7_9GLOM|nr:hypothetical protein GLOIN_2v1781805 [Rhizophagus clarus]